MRQKSKRVFTGRRVHCTCISFYLEQLQYTHTEYQNCSKNKKRDAYFEFLLEYNEFNKNV